MNALIASEARTKRAVRDFMEFPFRLYRHDPNWVPPLRSEQRKQLDPARNPFFQHAEAALFVARRHEEVVGRISAHTDERYNEFHSRGSDRDTTGFWGFFECVEDVDVAKELLEVAASWLAWKGKTSMVGPASFTLNDEAGLLVDGFDRPPVLMMTYNPWYYELLIDKAGFEPVQDLYAYRLDADTPAPLDVIEFAHSAEQQFTFRRIDMKDFEGELMRFLGVYNEAWERNWGFCPMTDAEIREHARQLKPIIDPNLVILAERGDEAVAVGLTLPDVNEALLRSRGRLGPATAARLLWKARRRHWKACRVVALGVKKAYRSTGVGAHLYFDTLQAAKRGGYRWGEMSWILESNDAMNRAIRHMGGTVYKTYRMYSRPVG